MQTIEYRGRIIECYGELQDNSNFQVCCEDEYEDGIWADGNPGSADWSFSSWQEVVETLSQYFENIEEITAV
jgi:hypothetical protein